jgi:hypothetical protein
MIPQGMVGAWLIVMSVVSRKLFPAHLTVLGVVAGIGLLMIAASLLTVLLYFGPTALSGPIRSADPMARRINQILHINLDVGSFLGKPTFPMWTILAARGLRRDAE